MYIHHHVAVYIYIYISKVLKTYQIRSTHGKIPSCKPQTVTMEKSPSLMDKSTISMDRNWLVVSIPLKNMSHLG